VVATAAICSDHLRGGRGVHSRTRSIVVTRRRDGPPFSALVVGTADDGRSPRRQAGSPAVRRAQSSREEG